MSDSASKKPEEPMGVIHVYVDGVRIDRIEPRLKFLDLDDWLTPCMKWAFEEVRFEELWAKFTGDPNKDGNARLCEIWFGEPSPAMCDDDPCWAYFKRKGPVSRFMNAIKKVVM